MKIKAIKNTIKQVEGTNRFEVKTVGKRTDLDDLRSKLKMYGFNFDASGEFSNYYPRTEELIELANELQGQNKLSREEQVEVITDNLHKYWDLYSDLKNKTYEYIYTLDMNSIEIVTEEDDEGRIEAKAVISIIKNNDTDELLTWKEFNNIDDEKRDEIFEALQNKYKESMKRVVSLSEEITMREEYVRALNRLIENEVEQQKVAYNKMIEFDSKSTK